MPGVFISYRREDSSGYTGRLFDIVSSHFGRQNTFMDLDAIQGGDDFTAVIEEKISVSDILLAVIGVHWVTITDEHGKRRLDNPRDFVRLEIGRALARGIRVIPVLVGGAVMPHAEDLPDDLLALCKRQAVEVRDAHFHSDAEQLIGILHKALHGVHFRMSNLNGKRFILALAVGIGIAIVLGVLLYQHRFLDTRHGPASVAEVSRTKVAGVPDNGALTHEHQDDRVQPENRSNSTANLADVSGKWNATVKYDWGDSYTEIFEFEVDGKEVSGSASFLGAGRGILNGRIEGSRISFMTKSLSTIGSDEKTYEDKHFYKGTFDTDKIRFTMMTDSSMESHVPIHFTASRAKTR
jgi:hypothetical protein